MKVSDFFSTNTTSFYKEHFMKKISIIAVAITLSPIASFGQSVALADMQQDVSMMRREVGQLRLEVEQLRNENAKLSQRIRSLESSAGATDAIGAQVSAVRSQNAAQIEKMKNEIIAQVRKDMENMANQTNVQMSKLANAISKTPTVSTPKEFSNDYPKTGVTHTVQAGDSLNKLARAYNSKVKWIQDANQITNPARDLRVGNSIFIPQK